MIEIRLKGVRRFTAKTKSISAYMRKGYAPDVIEDGYNNAKKIAPKKTGALITAIKTKKGKKSGKIILIQPNNPKSGTDRPYHLWMHGIKAPSRGGRGYDTRRGKYKPKSGDPEFMYTTAKYLEKISTERFKKKLKTL